MMTPWRDRRDGWQHKAAAGTGFQRALWPCRRAWSLLPACMAIVLYDAVDGGSRAMCQSGLSLQVSSCTAEHSEFFSCQDTLPGHLAGLQTLPIDRLSRWETKLTRSYRDGNPGTGELYEPVVTEQAGLDWTAAVLAVAVMVIPLVPYALAR